MLDAEEEAAGALLTVEDVVETVVVAGPVLGGAGMDEVAAVELLMGTVGACGVPLTVLVTGAIKV